ncbi:MAG TPA: peptidoglycan-binding protein [Candidatus Paceibacterota bacterium]|nr:peptidoglycan-binding protein [Candidatus Paceibacterota bacterium]
MRKLLSGLTLAALLPAAVSAATAQELQAQLQVLLQQVQALQAQTASASATSGGQCPHISRTLKQGMSGDDVTRLQQFLARDPSIYPEQLVTGYYGALTTAAVRRFQCRHQIVCDGTAESTGYGVVGPRTAAILAIQCPSGSASSTGGSANVGGYIRVTPTQGPAPLTVSVEATLNTTRSCVSAPYQLFFGDASPVITISAPVQGCNELRQTYTHTYTGPGTYTLTLRAGGHQTNATVTVTGSASNSSEDTFVVSPTTGNAPLNVSFTGKANASGSCSPSSYSIQFGDGTSSNIPVSNCSISTYAVTHGYTQSGTYVARFMRGSSQVTSTTIKVEGGPSTQGGGTFTVSPGYGGDAFSVLATFELSTTCTAYDIDWGDGTPHSIQNAGTCSAGKVTKEVSHTYAGNGTYTITLKRGTGSGQTTDTVGVTVVY